MGFEKKNQIVGLAAVGKNITMDNRTDGRTHARKY
jgi:hypothetical protein